MAQKIPPPPPIANQDPTFNRWLIELTSILNDNGDLNPDNIPGLATLSAEVTALGATVASQTSQLTTLNNQVAFLIASVVGLSSSVTTLEARSQVFNGSGDPSGGLGNVGDWYANTSGGAGHRIFIKTSVSAWFAFPF